MEIITIEARTFGMMMQRFETLVQKIDKLCDLHAGKELHEWLDNQGVCMILNISPRTLQTLRNTHKLAYTQIDRKMYYKPEDVERLINKNATKNEQ